MRGHVAFSPILAAALAVVPAEAGAVEQRTFVVDTAADLARLCAPPADNPLAAQALQMCHGYIVGVHHFHSAYAAATGSGLYCVEAVDPPPSRDSVAADFADWVAATPGTGPREAVDALLDWAAQRYPCE